ncbi:hypothetical protein HPB50_022716 [Hyalomma asiaticum]|uniref:Uncharacterized protein n=1 Tax=Hyalomma asiaticum TaxID=266040 RepID=A0ACB7SAR6_HYAAI|nr:hypothetical protein HPB50_022716 [Hyalomma asiaticum]
MSRSLPLLVPELWRQNLWVEPLPRNMTPNNTPDAGKRVLPPFRRTQIAPASPTYRALPPRVTSGPL